MKEDITIHLTKDEALVLFDFLGRFNQTTHTHIFQDQADRQPLWAIETQLDKVLVEPFKPDYLDIIREVRNRNRGEQ